MLGLGIHERVVALAAVQPDGTVLRLGRYLQPERVAVEAGRGIDVVDREATERLDRTAVAQ
jgi:hypothetical protein